MRCCVSTTEVVTLIYERDHGTETFSGSISGNGAWCKFTQMSFADMMGLTSNALCAAPSHRLIIKRVEAPYPMTLPEGFENLLRTDLRKAIETLYVGPQTVVIGAPRRLRKTRAVGLRVGHDTLADAIGDEVYLRVSTDWKIEDPLTGRWVPTSGFLDDHSQHKFGGLTLLPLKRGLQKLWTSVWTEDILGLNAARYYLPRGWNLNADGWITHNGLKSLYEQFKKEKANVQRS